MGHEYFHIPGIFKGHKFFKSLEIHELKHHEKNLAIQFEGVFKFHYLRGWEKFMGHE